MCPLNAGIQRGPYFVRIRAAALSSGFFPASLALSSVYLKLWLLLHSRNHTSTLQISSGCTVRRWQSAWSKPRPHSPPHPGEGRRRESSSSAPRAAAPVLFEEAFEPATAGSAARGGAVLAAAPRSPGSFPQRGTKFPASGRRGLRSAEPGGPT